MKIIDNLKRKFQIVNMPVTFSDEDIELLAAMQDLSGTGVKIWVGGIFTYSYYVPMFDEDLDLARDLFVKNGINMTVHRSKMYLSEHGAVETRNVLRVRDRPFKKGADTVKFIAKVQDALSKISKTEVEWYRVQAALTEKRKERSAR